MLQQKLAAFYSHLLLMIINESCISELAVLMQQQHYKSFPCSGKDI